MFGKRKPETNEDDPLVPHGMVWHATATPPPADKVDPAAATAKESNLEIVSRSNAPKTVTLPAATPGRKGSLGSCPPLSWEPVKRSEPGEVPTPFPAKKALPPGDFIPTVRRGAIRPRSMPQPPLRPDAVPQHPIPHHPIPDDPIGHGPVGQGAVRLSPTAQDGISQSSILPLPLDQDKSNGQQVADSGAVSTAIPSRRQIPEMLSGSFSRMIQGSQQVWSQTTSAFLRLRQSDWLHKRFLHFSGSINWQETVRRGGNFLGGGLKSACTALAHQRVRIRLGGTPLQAKIFLTRSISEWKLKRDNMRMDARLWSSMTMAAASALLVLGLISAARHYATQALPSRTGSTHSQANSKNQVPADVVPSKIAAQAAARPIEAAAHENMSAKGPQKSVGVHPKPVSTSSPVRKRPRAGDEKDYVAPDTYTYYGNRPQGSK